MVIGYAGTDYMGTTLWKSYHHLGVGLVGLKYISSNQTWLLVERDSVFLWLETFILVCCNFAIYKGGLKPINILEFQSGRSAFQRVKFYSSKSKPSPISHNLLRNLLGNKLKTNANRREKREKKMEENQTCSPSATHEGIKSPSLGPKQFNARGGKSGEICWTQAKICFWKSVYRKWLRIYQNKLRHCQWGLSWWWVKRS